MTAQERYDEWIGSLREDNPIFTELRQIEGNDKEIEERFSTELTFGTAGLRGKLGAGTSRMNRITVGRATQGFSNYILKHCDENDDEEPSVVIAFDPRHFSKEFAELSAEIFAGNGIKVYTFDSIRPTPELAFLIRRLNTTAGLNITASHNPRDYNGYKVYWSDGCQISGDVSDGIAKEIDALQYFDSRIGSISSAFKRIPSKTIQRMPLSKAKDVGLLVYLGEKEDREYLDRIEALSIHSKEELSLDIPLVYTPLNGAGSIPFETMLRDKGFSNFHIVPEQKDPDSDFTTVGYPNPEDPKAFMLSQELGKKVGAEVLLATDPDSDRFAIEILKNTSGNSTDNEIVSEDSIYLTPNIKEETCEYIPLNGNQTGYLLLDYILSGDNDTISATLNDSSLDVIAKESIRENEKRIKAVVRSIVTSPLSNRIAASHGAVLFESLTGFKNICGTIPWLIENGFDYRFGWEESVGYAACQDIRDKDGISAGMLISEMAAFYRKKGKTLYDVLMDIYERYGYYAEDEPFIIREGLSGKKEISDMMVNLRKNPLKSVAGYDVISVTDYLENIVQEITLTENLYEKISGFAEDNSDLKINISEKTNADGAISHILNGPAIHKSNVLKYVLSNGTTFFVRPSGTEPKIKFYFYSEGKNLDEAKNVNEQIKNEVLERVTNIK